ncbi:hypothetical protein QWY28_09120 [Nocardioides sp. SOB77]|uniref:Glycosyltransferase RgtA/B/C/D-like domain-containing protein n=1 Tax=Nocardioides oceani TaxID=3058369 RepID=A0ABT8FF98_9ACTN|nr:hypothetical protein [Nocardioides oceani]MDN4173100.1 hypothetical protein [Nocardioides oceani]
MRALTGPAAVISGRAAGGPRSLVLGGAVALVLAQLGFRAWAVLPSFFYLDDYRLLHEARAADLDADYAFRAYDSQFMPLGRTLAWLLSRGELIDWTWLAVSTLVMQLLASTACAVMLVVLLGWRRRVLLLLALYLSTALAVPATMWWAAAINQLPLHAAMFGAVAAWVPYLRTRRLRYLALTGVLVALGMLAYVKAVLVLVVLAWVVLAWFTTGGPVRRTARAVRRYWPAVLSGIALGGGFTAYYVTSVPQIDGGDNAAPAGALAERMLGSTLPTGLLGGPWRWDTVNPPVGLADPPLWTVHLSWVVLTVVVLYLALTRVRTLRAWSMLAAYALIAYLVLLLTRAPVVGAVSGNELRYLTDVVCVAVLALALASSELVGAPGSSEPRTSPLLLVRLRPSVVVAVALAVVASGTWSTVTYARIWHVDHPGEDYFGEAVRGTSFGPTPLADQTVPQNLVPGFLFPYNTTRLLLPMLTPRATFPEASESLHVLDESGAVHVAAVEGGIEAPAGPVAGCGYQVRDDGVTVELDGRTVGLEWWIRMEYIASADSSIRVEAGESTVDTEVLAGLGTLFVHVEGEVDSVALSGLEPGVTVCVDELEIGTPVPEDGEEEDQ